jgi:hypothetical protein
LAKDQQAEIESNDDGLVISEDDHDMQLREPICFSEDDDAMDEVSDSGHDVLEAEAYAELVSRFNTHMCYRFDATASSK